MLKNKVKLLTLLVTVALIFTTSYVFAEDATTESQSEAPVTATPTNSDSTTTNSTATTSENTTSNNSATPSTETNITKGDVYKTGSDVTIDSVVDGNIFIVADTVNINSQIGGDAFICAKNVTIGEQGYVFSNLFVIADTLTIKGIVYDVYAATKNINISGYIYRDVRGACSDKFLLTGTIGRNAFLTNCQNIAFTNDEQSDNTSVISNQGTITGNLEYSGSQELTIPNGAVGGNVSYNNDQNSNPILSYVLAICLALCLLIVIWLILSWITPKFLEKANTQLKSKPLPALGFGIVGLIVIPIIIAICFVLVITASIGVVLLLLYLALLAISAAVCEIAISSLVAEKLKVTNKGGKFGMLVLTGLVISLISLIPYIGPIIAIILIIMGFGLIISNIKPKKATAK